MRQSTAGGTIAGLDAENAAWLAGTYLRNNVAAGRRRLI
jgi:hypothetical protein